MEDYEEFIQQLKKIKDMGYVKTHRIGPTGIGKTLEDLLGIHENNIPSPNHKMMELKSARKNAKSMLTLFTKSPLPKKANSVLLKTFGYPSSRGNDRKELHTTVNAINYNTLKGSAGFKIDVHDDRIELVSKNIVDQGVIAFIAIKKREEKRQKEVLGYWDKETLKNSFERKLSMLIYVKADSKGSGSDEEFWFNEAWLLKGFDFDNFINLLKKGDILVDIRIGQYPDGKPHDHGTGFRVFPDKLDLCFSHRKRVM